MLVNPVKFRAQNNCQYLYACGLVSLTSTDKFFRRLSADVIKADFPFIVGLCRNGEFIIEVLGETRPSFAKSQRHLI